MKLASHLPFLRNARPMSREKADTLLLLFACSLVLMPHLPQAPAWVTASCILLLAWRCWLTFRGNRMPPRWLLMPVSALAMCGVYATFKTLIGRDAGVTMLLLLLALKLLEMHAKRDLFVVIFLSFFLMLTNLFNSQSIGTALLMVITVIMMQTAQLSFQYTGMVPPLFQRLKLSASIVALAVPLTLVMFILFPRIQGPLWGMPGEGQSGRTGLSETMTPGNFANLVQSDDVAFRVKFYDPVPAPKHLYWRAIVLGKYDGRTWKRRQNARPTDTPQFQLRHQPVRYQVTLEPNSKRWLMLLETPGAPPKIEGMSTTLNLELEPSTDQPITNRIRYDAQSYIGARVFPDMSAEQLQQWLELPYGFDSATISFARQLRRSTTDDIQRINAVLRYFRDESFRYTLHPPALGRNVTDEFLFATRAGFCEHYSSAFVVLMRAMGIPARVINGYQGGEINPVDGFMTLRQSDAHAWAEVWLPGQGWLRVDPTSAVAPERVERGMSVAMPRTMLGGLLTVDLNGNSWLATLRYRWDAVANGWNQWVLNYTPEKQKSFIKSLGFDEVDWRTLSILLAIVGTIVLAVIALPLLANRQKSDPTRALYLRFCQLMANKGCGRADHEGPRDYRMRIEREASSLPPEKKSAAARFLAFYEAVQYGTVSDFSRSANIARLKSLLAECR